MLKRLPEVLWGRVVTVVELSFRYNSIISVDYPLITYRMKDTIFKINSYIKSFFSKRRIFPMESGDIYRITLSMWNAPLIMYSL